MLEPGLVAKSPSSRIAPPLSNRELARMLIPLRSRSSGNRSCSTVSMSDRQRRCNASRSAATRMRKNRWFLSRSVVVSSQAAGIESFEHGIGVQLVVDGGQDEQRLPRHGLGEETCYGSAAMPQVGQLVQAVVEGLQAQPKQPIGLRQAPGVQRFPGSAPGLLRAIVRSTARAGAVLSRAAGTGPSASTPGRRVIRPERAACPGGAGRAPSSRARSG